jgi:hypothetical protein
VEQHGTAGQIEESRGMNSGELSTLLEFTEGAATAEMFRAAPTEFSLEVVESDEYVARFTPKIDVMMFNRVVGLGLKTRASKGTVDALVKGYVERGVKNFALQISPEANPPELHNWLADHGLEIRDSWSKMYRPATPVDQIKTDLRIERIDKSRADLFGQTACNGFGMPDTLSPMVGGPVGLPDWFHYIAFDGSTPAAVAALFVRNGVGWLGIAATLPDYRNRGAQGALMTRRIQDGIDQGCDFLITETWKEIPEKPNPSYRNMLRTGFIAAYDRPNYMMPKEHPANN